MHVCEMCCYIQFKYFRWLLETQTHIISLYKVALVIVCVRVKCKYQYVNVLFFGKAAIPKRMGSNLECYCDYCCVWCFCTSSCMCVVSHSWYYIFKPQCLNYNWLVSCTLRDQF